jgi:hypothetical protein
LLFCTMSAPGYRSSFLADPPHGDTARHGAPERKPGLPRRDPHPPADGYRKRRARNARLGSLVRVSPGSVESAEPSCGLTAVVLPGLSRTSLRGVRGLGAPVCRSKLPWIKRPGKKKAPVQTTGHAEKPSFALVFVLELLDAALAVEEPVLAGEKRMACRTNVDGERSTGALDVSFHDQCLLRSISLMEIHGAARNLRSLYRCVNHLALGKNPRFRQKHTHAFFGVCACVAWMKWRDVGA